MLRGALLVGNDKHDIRLTAERFKVLFKAHDGEVLNKM